jgi:hypothetical protein
MYESSFYCRSVTIDSIGMAYFLSGDRHETSAENWYRVVVVLSTTDIVSDP